MRTKIFKKETKVVDGYLRYPTEAYEQVKLCDWLDRNCILYTHPPNGEKRPIKSAMRLKRMGVKPGVPDILVFSRPHLETYRLDEVRGLAIEMKSLKGVLSTSQKIFHERLTEHGWVVATCKSAEEAIVFLMGFGFGVE